MLTLLKPVNYCRIHALVRAVACEKALVRAALSGETRSEVFVDNADCPKVALLSYNNEAIIVGEPQQLQKPRSFFKEITRQRDSRQFSSIICPSVDWKDLFCTLSRGTMEHYERIHFRFVGNARSPEHPANLPGGFTLREIDQNVARSILNEPNSPFHDFRAAWRSPAEFCQHGYGLCIERNDEIASIAFSCFPVTDVLEIASATRPHFRRAGFAYLLSSKLIANCVENGIEPLVSSLASNSASGHLARSLGFVESGRYYVIMNGRSGIRRVFGSLANLIRDALKP